MKNVLLLTSFGTLLFCGKASAQQVNTDSLKWVSKISEDQLKLGKLQNTVDQKTQAKQDDAIKAQQSANKNVTDANRLSNDPENKRDARQANKSASDAKSDAKKARKASDDLDKVNQKIAKLQIKISDEKMELNKYTKGAAPDILAKDTTRHP